MSKKRHYEKCPQCGWYIGKALLDEEHYDGVCPVCDYDFNEDDADGTGS